MLHVIFCHLPQINQRVNLIVLIIYDTVVLSDENLAEVSQPLNRQASHDHIPTLKRTDRTPAATSVSGPQHFW